MERATQYLINYNIFPFLGVGKWTRDFGVEVHWIYIIKFIPWRLLRWHWAFLLPCLWWSWWVFNCVVVYLHFLIFFWWSFVSFSWLLSRNSTDWFWCYPYNFWSSFIFFWDFRFQLDRLWFECFYRFAFILFCSRVWGWCFWRFPANGLFYAVRNLWPLGFRIGFCFIIGFWRFICFCLWTAVVFTTTSSSSSIQRLFSARAIRFICVWALTPFWIVLATFRNACLWSNLFIFRSVLSFGWFIDSLRRI